MSLPIALQLYTVRDNLAKDFEGTLKAVADIGYKYVELAGLHGKTPQQAKQTLDKLGLTVTSSHLGVDDMRDKLPAAIADAKVLGYKYLICPWLPTELQNPQGYRQVAKTLEDAGKRSADAGMTICYHNHSFEWAKLADGSRGIDILYNETDPKYLQAELDVYWVQHGHDDPLAWMKKLSGRVPLLHIKDMDKTPNRGFAEVGTGTVDIAGVVNAAAGVGAKYLIVEQDGQWKGSPVDSARLSYQNLKKLV